MIDLRLGPIDSFLQIFAGRSGLREGRLHILQVLFGREVLWGTDGGEFDLEPVHELFQLFYPVVVFTEKPTPAAVFIALPAFSGVFQMDAFQPRQGFRDGLDIAFVEKNTDFSHLGG